MRRKTSDPKSPVVLGIETATPWGGVALVEPATEDSAPRMISHRWFHAPAGYSRQLLYNIQGSLREMKREPGAICAIACSHGPGSFTGVRIGLTTAKTLAQSLQVPLYLCSTLECAARRWPHPGATICVMFDARRNEVYSAVYRATELGDVQEIRPPAVEPPATTLEALDPIAGPVDFMGDGAALYRSKIEEAMGERAKFVPAPWNHPAADTVAMEGAKKFSAGIEGIEPFAAVPFYLRASDAQRNLEPSGKGTS